VIKLKSKPVMDQITALPVHSGKTGKPRLLMATSRDRGALGEVQRLPDERTHSLARRRIRRPGRGRATNDTSNTMAGRYHYDKRVDHGKTTHWFSAGKATKRVGEKARALCLRAVAEAHRTLAVFEEMRRTA
jgi:hypothetical protein